MQQLGTLAMSQTRFEVAFAGAELAETRWRADGIDEAEFFVSPNPGEDLRPLARIASGGELSRIMLAIKTLAAGGGNSRRKGALAPGLVFDEVDAGIGGRAADVVGQTLRTLGSRCQVLCITHLPQIAAYADAHFHVAKSVDGGRTRVTVAGLDDEGRVGELGRMLGGAQVTAGIRASALEMLATRRRSESEPKSKGESESSTGKPPRAAARSGKAG
jgi:DNA repair protein RecN (Recombination protein N)